MKAIILAAGRGKRLTEITNKEINKCMIEVKGQPLIQYNLDSAVNCNISEILIVVGFQAEAIINTFGIEYKGVKIKYVIQQEPRGVVHALEQCQSYLEGEDFFLFLGDELHFEAKPKEMLKKFEDENLFSICGVTDVEDKERIKKTYAIIYNESSEEIYRLIEKPRNPINNLMGTGNCIFRNEIFFYVQHTPINQVRQEKELPDLIQCAIDDGKKVKLFRISSHYVNINSPDDIETAEKLFNSL